jgi:hypothetical protein
VSANAFKAITPLAQIQIHQGRATEASVNADDNAENNGDMSAPSSRKRSHADFRSSSPLAVARSHSSSPVAGSHIESCSSSPVAPLQKKAKTGPQFAPKGNHGDMSAPSSRKRSHADFRSSSPLAVACSHSSSPVAGSHIESRSSSPVAPLQKKAKTGPQFAPKDQSTIPVYRAGAEINHKKPKASDYEDVVHALILRAASQYEASVSTQDSFPDTTQRLKWARKSWSDANNDADLEYEITDEISSLVNLSNLF